MRSDKTVLLVLILAINGINYGKSVLIYFFKNAVSIKGASAVLTPSPQNFSPPKNESK